MRAPIQVHPWQIIAEELEARGWSMESLALRMPGDPGFNLLALQFYSVEEPGCCMDQESANGIGHALDVDPQFFMNLDAAWQAANRNETTPAPCAKEGE